ncbi:MAG: hypothetical protein ACLFQK_12270 [Fibrobacterota bacterium]
MKKAVIIYRSRKGTTGKYGREIAEYLKTKEINVSIASTEDFRKEMLEGTDYLLTGCWTAGLFVILQHPDNEWKKFAASLPEAKTLKTAFFTTYKFLTGSMFDKMSKEIEDRLSAPSLTLKSRNGSLSEEDKKSLDGFIS